MATITVYIIENSMGYDIGIKNPLHRSVYASEAKKIWVDNKIQYKLTEKEFGKEESEKTVCVVDGREAAFRGAYQLAIDFAKRKVEELRNNIQFENKLEKTIRQQ